MSTIRLRLGDEVFDIPTVGASNWGEQITLYLRKNSEIIATLQGPQDILLTDFTPTLDAQGAGSGNVVGLKFATASIQQIIVDGIIIREITSENPLVDSFRCEGIYNKDTFYIDSNYVGTDAKVRLNIDGNGQFSFTADAVENTSTVLIRFRAKAIIDI